MSEKEPSKNKPDTSTQSRSSVVSSAKCDPKSALEYWTKEEMDKAKPIPFPDPDVTKSGAQDDEDNDK